MTNIERIKAMPAEEMAEFLLDIATRRSDCRECFAFRYCNFIDCGISFEKWLESEVQDDEWI